MHDNNADSLRRKNFPEQRNEPTDTTDRSPFSDDDSVDTDASERLNEMLKIQPKTESYKNRLHVGMPHDSNTEPINFG